MEQRRQPELGVFGEVLKRRLELKNGKKVVVAVRSVGCGGEG